MTYLPTNVFKNIMEYCDDRLEKQQKTHHTRCMTQIERLPSNWYWKYMECQYYVDSLMVDSHSKEQIVELLTEAGNTDSAPVQFKLEDDEEDLDKSIYLATLENIIFRAPYDKLQYDDDGIVMAITEDDSIPLHKAVWIDFEGYTEVV